MDLAVLASENNVPPAAGRLAAGPTKTNTGTTQPTPEPRDGAAPPGGGASALIFPLLLILPLLLLMIWSSRSQQKKQAATLAGLQKGDRVLLQGGLLGKLVEMGDKTAKIELAPGVKVDVLKSGITGKDGTDGAATGAKK